MLIRSSAFQPTRQHCELPVTAHELPQTSTGDRRLPIKPATFGFPPIVNTNYPAQASGTWQTVAPELAGIDVTWRIDTNCVTTPRQR